MNGTDDPEATLWRRIRVWTDAMPWLALARCLRPATSPILLMLAAAAFWLAAAGVRLIDGAWPSAALPVPEMSALAPDASVLLADADSAGHPALAAALAEAGAVQWPVTANGRRWAEQAWATAPNLIDAAHSVAAPALSLGEPGVTGKELLRRLAIQLWLVVVWAVPAGWIVRQGMLAVAGRQPMGCRAGAMLALKRLPALLLAALLPITAATAAGCFFLIPGWLWRIPTVGPWLAEPLGLVAIPLAVAAGLLAFGSLLAVPLAWAAVMGEQQGDAFDALSRGYEYVFRRPLQLAFYLLLAWLISRVAGALATGIAMASVGIADRFSAWAAGQSDPLTLAPAVLGSLPVVFAIVLFWALVGGMYLLLRRDANVQEVEDVWEPPSGPSQSFPVVPR